MQHTKEHQKKKFFIGFALRTNNEECSSAMPAHKEKFFKENIPSKIPNKVSFEVYSSGFDPQTNPQVKIYIAIDR